tara:strand:+ start:351 stop:923 length:573 start_codon:yes stop_codon:yes gene_type:complete
MNQEPLIHVFENEIPFNTRINLYDFCSKSQFELGWKDGNNVGENKYASNIHSSWSKENILLIDQSCNFIFYLKKCISQTPFFINKFLERIELNLVRSDDVHYIHSHPGRQVVLYYVNLDWEDGWYGETLFYDPHDLDKVCFTSTYKPGRIILFDGRIPHAIRPQSIKAPKYRFTLSLFFINDQENGGYEI